MEPQEVVRAYVSSDGTDYVALDQYISHVVDRSLRKRKKRQDSVQIIEDSAFVELVDAVVRVSSTKLVCHDAGKAIRSTDKALGLQLDVTLKFNAAKNVIEVWSPAIGAGKAKKPRRLLDLQVDGESFQYFECVNRFFRSKYKAKRFMRFEMPTLMDLELKVESDEMISISFDIRFKLGLQQAVDGYHSANFMKNFHRLCGFVFSARLTEYQRAGGTEVPKPTESNFYSLVTDNTARNVYDKDSPMLTVPGIAKKLLGFQGQSLQWMLRHEGFELDTSRPQFSLRKLGSILGDGPVDDETLSRALDECCFGWTRVQFVRRGGGGSKTYWLNRYSCSVCDSEFALSRLHVLLATRPPAQALLCEEMGLGKTVEVLSLIQANKRVGMAPFEAKKADKFAPLRQVAECKSTLVICPQTILGQWYNEVKETSDLSVTVYEGFMAYEKQAKSAKRGYVDPQSVAKSLAEYDVVLVSYHTVSRELHRAVFCPTSRPKRHCAKRLEAASETAVESEYQRIDYSSPLMLLEFWRVVLDEVQMTANINANASKFARIIPRVHSWGVSGTLIKTGLDDLHSLLSFLRYAPIDRFSCNCQESPWRFMIQNGPYYEFGRLFQNICIRHTKKMVAEQVQLPKQNRVMLRAPFTSIERDNYDFLFGQFLTQVGLDVDGNPIVEEYDPSQSYSYMRRWLVKLRQICCHAQLGRSTYGGGRRHGKDDGDDDKDGAMVVGSLSEVLSELIRLTNDQYCSNGRAYHALELKKGKIYEFLRQPEKSLRLFEQVIPKIEARIEDQMEQASKRAWLEMLHQAYFLIASSHYQHYRPMSALEDNFEDLMARIEKAKADEPENLEVDPTTLTEEERQHYDLENQYYTKADSLLLQILEDPLRKVDENTKKMLAKFDRMPRYKVGKEELLEVCRVYDLENSVFADNFGFDPQTAQFCEKARTTLRQLNTQAHVVNRWITKLVELLRQPVTKAQDVEKLTGQEYAETLVNQEQVNTYLESLRELLENRQPAIMWSDDAPLHSRRKEKKTGETARTRDKEGVTEVGSTINKDLFIDLDKVRRDCIPDGCFQSKFSLRVVSLDLASVELTHDNLSLDFIELVRELASSAKEEYDLQRKNVTSLRGKVFDLLDDTFNAKVSYFRALQVKSDALTNYVPDVPRNSDVSPAEAAEAELQTVDQKLSSLQIRMGRENVRLRYLESLTNGPKDKSSSDRICVICRSQILVGTLTACGHQYCKECLKEWMKNKPTCPVCNRTLQKSDMYTFTATRQQLKGGLMEDSQRSPEEQEQKVELEEEVRKLNNARMMEQDLFKIYKSLDNNMLREIVSLPLVESYGSKIDMIVRQALFLRKQQPGVQILVFSQWPDFLRLLGKALLENQVLYVSSVTPLRGRRKSAKVLGGSTEIERFKKDSKITCFLLNAKAQAAGLTLTNASHVFLCEPLVNLSLELQAISRIHRIGQTQPTTVWNFVIEDTVEESIAYLSTKRRLDFFKGHRDEVDEEVDEDALGVTELSKNLDKLVDKQDGEVIANSDLWASFFANKSAQVMDAVV